MIPGKLEQNTPLSTQGVEALINGAISLVKEELDLLSFFHSNTLKYYLCQRFFSPSDIKIDALKRLKFLLSEADRSDLHSLKIKLTDWRQAHLSLMKPHQNHIHAYFNPSQMTRTEKMLLNVFHVFAIDDLEPWVYNTNLKYL